MQKEQPPVGIIDVGRASSGSIQFLANEMKMAAPGSGMSFALEQAARESRKHKAVLTPPPAEIPTGLLASLLRRI